MIQLKNQLVIFDILSCMMWMKICGVGSVEHVEVVKHLEVVKHVEVDSPRYMYTCMYVMYVCRYKEIGFLHAEYKLHINIYIYIYRYTCTRWHPVLTSKHGLQY